jgi:hypothetical protein
MPTSSSVHVDSALSNIAIQYKNNQFIADRILPVITVNKRSDSYYKFTKSDTFTRVMPLTGPKAEVTEADYTLTTGSYDVLDYALKGFVSYTDMKNADAPLDLLADETEHLTNLLYLHREKMVADVVFASATYDSANKATPTTKWGNASATPIAQIITAQNALVGIQGPYCAAFGNKAWELFRQHPDVLGAFQPTSPGVVATQQQVANFFGFEEVLVGDAFYNSALPGATASYSRIWDDHVLIFKRNTSARVKDVSLGHVFQCGALDVQRWEDLSKGPNGGEWVKAGWSYDIVTTASDAGYLIYDVYA